MNLSQLFATLGKDGGSGVTSLLGPQSGVFQNIGLANAVSPAGGVFGATGAGAQALAGKGRPDISMANVPTLTPEESKPLGFFDKLNAVDASTGESTLGRIEKFGAQLDDTWGDGGDSAAAYDTSAKKWVDDRKALAQRTEMNKQIDAAYPNDPNARLLMRSNPEAFTKALATRYAAENVAPGASRVYGEGGSVYTAPSYEDADGFGFDKTTGQYGERRGPSWDERNTAGRNAAEAEHWERGDQTGNFNAQTGRMNAGVNDFSARSADWQRRASENRLGGGGGGGAAGGVSDEQLLRALRGGR